MKSLLCGRYKHRPTDQRHLTVIVIRSEITAGNSQYCNIRTLFQLQIRTLLQPIKILFSQSEYFSANQNTFFFSKSEYFYSQSKHSKGLQLSILLGGLLNAQFHLKQPSEGMKGGVKEIKKCENLHSGQSRSDPCDCVGGWFTPTDEGWLSDLTDVMSPSDWVLVHEDIKYNTTKGVYS